MADMPQPTAVPPTSSESTKLTIPFKERSCSCNPFSRFFSNRRSSSLASGVSNADSGICVESSKRNLPHVQRESNPDSKRSCGGEARQAHVERRNPSSVDEVLGQVEITVEEVPSLRPSGIGAIAADSAPIFTFSFASESRSSNLHCKDTAQAPKSSKQTPFARILASLASLEEKWNNCRTRRENKKELKKRQQFRRRSSAARTKAIDEAHRKQIALHREREKKRNERSKQKIKEENQECREKERKKKLAEKRVQREEKKEELD